MKKILISVVLTLALFTGCSNAKKDSSDIKVVKYEKDKISLNYSIVDDKNVVVEVINNGENIDYATINFAVYDKAGKLIGVEKQYLHALASKQNNFVKVSLTDIVGEKEKVNKIEMTVNTGKYETNLEKNYSDKVVGKVEKSETDGQLDLTLTNNSGSTIGNLSAVVAFYKKGNLVDIYSISAQNVDATYTDKVYVPLVAKKDGSMAYVDYDDTKVVVNYAISY